jgi:hypothetical protein
LTARIALNVFIVWSNIKASVIEFMENCKEAGTRKALANRCGTRFKQIKGTFDQFQRSGHPYDLVARAADICFMPEVRFVMEEATDEEFVSFAATVLDDLPELSRKCLKVRETFMTNLIPKPATQSKEPAPQSKEPAPTEDSPDDAPPSASPKEMLNLATTWFKCRIPASYCMNAFRCEEAHRHPCLFTNQYKTSDTENHTYIQQLETQPWNLYADGLTYATREAAATKELLEACGKDPTTTTAEEMDELKLRFLLRKPSSVEILGWRGIVSAFIPLERTFLTLR